MFSDNFDFNRNYYNQFGRFIPFDFINQVIPVLLKVTGREILDVHLAYTNGTTSNSSKGIIPAIPMIAKECSIILNNKERPPTRRELLTGVRNRDAILCTLSDKIDRRVMEVAGSTLRVISSYSTGVDHIDTEEATKRGIYVTTTGDILTETVADLAFALVLAISRQVTQGYELVIQKRWKAGADPNLLLGSDVHGMTMGILGLGRIGSGMARRAKGFDMSVIYHTRLPNIIWYNCLKI